MALFQAPILQKKKKKKTDRKGNEKNKENG
jgi:hypothetical protein